MINRHLVWTWTNKQAICKTHKQRRREDRIATMKSNDNKYKITNRFTNTTNSSIYSINKLINTNSNIISQGCNLTNRQLCNSKLNSHQKRCQTLNCKSKELNHQQGNNNQRTHHKSHTHKCHHKTKSNRTLSSHAFLNKTKFQKLQTNTQWHNSIQIKVK